MTEAETYPHCVHCSANCTFIHYRPCYPCGQ
jgi:hypothetical protein